MLHSHGINVRYLGEVVRKMGRHPFTLVVLLHMVARVVKVLSLHTLFVDSLTLPLFFLFLCFRLGFVVRCAVRCSVCVLQSTSPIAWLQKIFSISCFLRRSSQRREFVCQVLKKKSVVLIFCFVSYWAEEVPRLLNVRFQIRPGNWNGFPKHLKKTIFEMTTVFGVPFNAKVRRKEEV